MNEKVNGLSVVMDAEKQNKRLRKRQKNGFKDTKVITTAG